MENRISFKWEHFQENVTSWFCELRSDIDFTDVTLACEDGLVEAHKTVLSLSSPWFKTLLLGKIRNTQHPFIYMRGLETRVLEGVMNFIYQGQVNVLQEDLEAFLKIGQDLQVKGLDSNVEESQVVHHNLGNPKMMALPSERNTTEPNLKKLESYGFALSKDATTAGEEEIENQPAVQKPDFLNTADEDVKHLIETAKQIDAMMKKEDNLWRCTVCDYSSRAKTRLKQHVETHIESMLYQCNYCGKDIGSTNSLRKHILISHNQNEWQWKSVQN